MKTICKRCEGIGWYADHSPYHYANPIDSSCNKYGCPVRVECKECHGTGEVEVLESETELFNQILNDERQ